MILVRTLFCALVGMFIILWFSDAKLAREEEQQNPFHVYTLNTGRGYYGAAFSPDDRFVALIASKGSLGGQGAEVLEEIQIWDFRNKKLVSEKVLSRQSLPIPDASYERGVFLYTYSHSGSMIVLYRNGHLVLLDAHTLQEIRDIDLRMANWPKFPPNSGDRSFINKVAVDKDADRAAVLLQWGLGGGGELRVYDLKSGSLVRKWDYHSVRTSDDRNADFGGMDIAPDGREVAISLIPFVLGEGVLHSWDRNVFVLDVDSGAKVAEMNTGYPAGDICFTPTAPPTLLTVSADNFERGRSRNDTIKIWNAKTGKLLREIASPPEGVHFQVQVSSDGHRVLGYTGLEKFEGRWWLVQEETHSVAYDKFRLWDLTTGRVIASSPEIPPSASHRRFQLSPKGDVVLLYPISDGGRPLTFYELLSTPQNVTR